MIKLNRWSFLLFVMLLLLLPLLAVAQETDDNSGNSNSFFATNTPMAATGAPQPLATEAAPTAMPAIADDQGDAVTVAYPPECAYVEGQPTSAACIAIMEANPEPDVTEIRQDGLTLSQYSFWRVGPQAVTTYDNPGGAPVGQIPQGFNFVNAVNQIDGWIQSEDGAWISTNDAYYVPASTFTGVLLPDDWQLPFGWILDTTGIYASEYPGGPSSSATGLVPLHYERFNIFWAERDADGWVWYLVGPDQWVKQIHMTVIKPTPVPDGVSGRWTAIDLYEQSLVAYDGNQPVFATVISTGLPGTETNEGLFTVWARLQRDGMSGATGAPNAYALQSVPWVMYFDDSISLHGTYWHDTFGYRRSRGCVNLSISDARWMYDFFDDVLSADGDAYVYVHSTGEYR